MLVAGEHTVIEFRVFAVKQRLGLFIRDLTRNRQRARLARQHIPIALLHSRHIVVCRQHRDIRLLASVHQIMIGGLDKSFDIDFRHKILTRIRNGRTQKRLGLRRRVDLFAGLCLRIFQFRDDTQLMAVIGNRRAIGITTDGIRPKHGHMVIVVPIHTVMGDRHGPAALTVIIGDIDRTQRIIQRVPAQ